MTKASTPRPRGARENRRDNTLGRHKPTHTPRNYDPNTPTQHKTKEVTVNPPTHLDPISQWLGRKQQQRGGPLAQDIAYSKTATPHTLKSSSTKGSHASLNT